MPGGRVVRARAVVLMVAALVASLCAAVGVPAALSGPAGAVVSPAGTFVSVAPSRLLDTRTGIGVPAAGPVAGGQTVALQVQGRAGVPGAGVSAVVLDVTVTQPTATGVITAYADGTALPTASNLNFVPGQTVPNLAVVPVGGDGKIDLHVTSHGRVHLIADVAGYFLGGTPTTPGSFGPVAPTRLLDTRIGLGAPAAPVAAGQTIVVRVDANPAVPVSAVVLNVTVTQPSANGVITVYADGAPLPTASNLNYVKGQTVPNLVMAPVGADGSVDLRVTGHGTVHLIADVSGYFLAGSPTVPGTFGALSPARLLDTRVGDGAPQAAVFGGQTVALQVDGRGGVPPAGVSAVVLNVTVTQPTATGVITAFADGTALPTASNLNFVPGQTVPNLVVAPVGADGRVALHLGGGGSAQLIADVSGYFLSEGSPVITSGQLPDATIGRPYSARLATADGRAGTWMVTQGPVPDGIALVGDTIAGTATTPGRASFIVTFTDTFGQTASSWLYFGVVPYLGAATAIAGGDTHSCGILSGGTVDCWGDNSGGALGTTTASWPSPLHVSGLSGAVAISAGYDHSCALLSGGTVECWGDRALGDGTNNGSSTPVTVLGLSGVTAISDGFYDSCALLSGGTVDCWGGNYQGQLGDGTTTNAPSPVPVPGISGAIAIATGAVHTCALLSGGTVDCWGDNRKGQLGDGTTTNRRLGPGAVSVLSGVTAITAGNYFTCALLSSGTVDCWGDNSYVQLGNGTSVNSLLPTPVSTLSHVTAITAGRFHACALISSGLVDCWGSNAAGQLGDGTRTFHSTPVEVPSLTGVTAIAAGGQHTCALLTATVDCWGYNYYGQVGDGNEDAALIPTPVSGL